MSLAQGERRGHVGRFIRLEGYMQHLRNRIIVFGSLAVLAIGAGACMVDDDLEGAAEQSAMDEAALDEGALGEFSSEEAGEEASGTSELRDVPPEGYKPGTGPITTSLHRGRARVGWPAAGIDLCHDFCLSCFYPRTYDKVFHQNHIVYVDTICGDAAMIHDNYGNRGMMRKDALYNW
jgi:hypothetical protein